MAEWMFETPGRVDEVLSKPIKQAWNQWLADVSKDSLSKMLGLIGSGDRSDVAYVNPAEDDLPADRTTVPVDWPGFPRFVDFSSNQPFVEVETKGYEDWGRPRKGDQLIALDSNEKPLELKTRHRQDEYVEWEAVHKDGKLESVTFVAEGYDYWRFLFEQDPNYVRDAYRERCQDNSIEAEDLLAPVDAWLYLLSDNKLHKLDRILRRDEFNPRNELNQGPGIVHLSHRANSLHAEVVLAITSAIPRVDANDNLVDASNPHRLMCCTDGGDPNRASDPRIAAAAYEEVTRKGDEKRFTLTNPIGLYIQSYDHHGDLRDPQGNEVDRDAFWTVERGQKPANPEDPKDSRVLRVKVESHESYALGDMFVGTTPLEHPGQLAKLIQMHLMVDVWRAPQTTATLECEGGCCVDAQEILHPYEPGDRSCASRDLEDPWPNLLKKDAPKQPRLTLRSRRMP